MCVQIVHNNSTIKKYYYSKFKKSELLKLCRYKKIELKIELDKVAFYVHHDCNSYIFEKLLNRAYEK